MASLSQLQHKISHCSLLTLNQAYGLAMEKPAATLRHYLTSATRIFRGEHEGLRQLGAAGRAVPRAAHQIPVYVGGIASQSLAVTGELADGSFVTQCAPQGLPEVREGLAKGAQRAGRALADIPIALLTGRQAARGAPPGVHDCLSIVSTKGGVTMSEISQKNEGETMLQSAIALSPKIKACTEEIERERRLPMHLIQAMKDAHIFGMAMPRA